MPVELCVDIDWLMAHWRKKERKGGPKKRERDRLTEMVLDVFTSSSLNILGEVEESTFPSFYFLDAQTRACVGGWLWRIKTFRVHEFPQLEQHNTM